MLLSLKTTAAFWAVPNALSQGAMGGTTAWINPEGFLIYEQIENTISKYHSPCKTPHAFCLLI